MTSGGVADQLQYEHPRLPPGPVTYEQFLAWADGSRAEWVDGEIILMSPLSLEHQDVLNFINRLISAFVEARQLGRVFFMGVQMRLRARPSGREPDLLFVSNEHADRLRPTYLDGPADLVVKIVSPESVERDRVTKLAEYEAADIPEYWLIDVLRRGALFYRLGDDGRYHLDPIDADGYYRSAVLSGFRLRVDWLWQRPLPPVAAVAAETAG
jgi:Uma2 family endonuclease